MNPDLNTVLDAAMQLPPDQRAELIERLSRSAIPEKVPGRLRKYFGMIDSGDTNSADNEKIDDDIAKAYLDEHETEN